MTDDEVELSLLDNMDEASSEKAESVSKVSPPVPDRCLRNFMMYST